MDWRNLNKANSFSENVMLAYFSQATGVWKPPTLWSVYSMLKTVLSCQHNVDISKYERLLAFLKKNSVGYASKKSQVFTSEQIQTFLREAPDEIYLPAKVCKIKLLGF